MMKIEDFKMRVTPEQNKIVQETIFSDKYDCQWNAFVVDKTISQTSAPYLYLENGRLLYGVRHDMFLSENKKELSFEEFKQRYIDKDFVLPEQWCVRDCEEVALYAHEKWGCGNYISPDRYYHGGGYEFYDYYIHEGYTEITLEQFKKYVLKQDDMKEKKIIGYKPKDINCFEYAKNFAKNYTAYGYDEGYSNVRIIAPSCGHYQFFKEAGVLDLWFEPVYEEEKKLPKICGYDGVFKKNDGTVKYGCKNVPVAGIRKLKGAIDSLNEGVESITLSTGESITKEQIDQIVEYTQHV
jgi:hypothetical protein